MKQRVKLRAFVESLDELGTKVYYSGDSIGLASRDCRDIWITDDDGRMCETTPELFKHPVYQRLSEKARNRIEQILQHEENLDKHIASVKASIREAYNEEMATKRL